MHFMMAELPMLWVCVITALVTILIILLAVVVAFLIWRRCCGPFKAKFDSPETCTMDLIDGDMILKFILTFKLPRDGCVNFVFAKVNTKLFVRKVTDDDDPMYGPIPKIVFSIKVKGNNAVNEQNPEAEPLQIVMSDEVKCTGITHDYQVKQLMDTVQVDDLPFNNPRQTLDRILRYIKTDGVHKFNQLRKRDPRNEGGVLAAWTPEGQVLLNGEVGDDPQPQVGDAPQAHVEHMMSETNHHLIEPRVADLVDISDEAGAVGGRAYERTDASADQTIPKTRAHNSNYDRDLGFTHTTRHEDEQINRHPTDTSLDSQLHTSLPFQPENPTELGQAYCGSGQNIASDDRPPSTMVRQTEAVESFSGETYEDDDVDLHVNFIAHSS